MTEKLAAPPRRTQAERTDEARNALIDAAVDLIAERGLAGVTLSDVGARAGYSRGLAVYHFGSKSGLILAVYDHVRGIGARAMKQFAKAQPTPGAQLLSLFDAIADTAEKGPALYRATTALLIDGAMSIDPAILARTRQAEAEALSIIADKVKATALKAGVDPDALAQAILSGLYGVQMRAFMMGDAYDVRASLDGLKTFTRAFLV